MSGKWSKPFRNTDIIYSQYNPDTIRSNYKGVLQELPDNSFKGVVILYTIPKPFTIKENILNEYTIESTNKDTVIKHIEETMEQIWQIDSIK